MGGVCVVGSQLWVLCGVLLLLLLDFFICSLLCLFGRIELGWVAGGGGGGGSCLLSANFASCFSSSIFCSF